MILKYKIGDKVAILNIKSDDHHIVGEIVSYHDIDNKVYNISIEGEYSIHGEISVYECDMEKIKSKNIQKLIKKYI